MQIPGSKVRAVPYENMYAFSGPSKCFAFVDCNPHNYQRKDHYPLFTDMRLSVMGKTTQLEVQDWDSSLSLEAMPMPCPLWHIASLSQPGLMCACYFSFRSLPKHFLSKYNHKQ